jgi:thiamine biosynthesis lipoprotein
MLKGSRPRTIDASLGAFITMMRAVGSTLLGASLASSALSGCAGPGDHLAQPSEVEAFSEIAMGVDVSVKVAAPDPQDRLSAARLAMAEVRACDDALSDWQASSERSRLPRTAGEAAVVSDRLFAATARSIELARATDGRFDPTVSPVVRAWRAARAQGRLPDTRALDAARECVGWQAITLDASARTMTFGRDGMELDFGGIGKGFAAQRASAAMVASGQRCHLVAVAGDLVAGPVAPPGRSGWTIRKEDGLGEPFELVLLGEAVSTSGDLEQFIEIDGVRHSHIIDPRTGRALRDRTAACVRGPDGATCDALATALCVAGVRDAAGLLRSFPGYRACVTTSESGGRRTWSTTPGPEGPPCAADTITVSEFITASDAITGPNADSHPDATGSPPR